MSQITSKDITKIRSVREQIHRLGIQQQREEIAKASPYSADITPHIRIYNELRLYYSLQLQESYITRPCLVREIDFDLWVTSENCTNLDLMQKGKSPYAFDAPEGRIEIHHIGQNHAAPFVELTQEEHNENSQLLHFSRQESWRTDNALSGAFDTERISYWKRRAKRDYIIAEIAFPKLQEAPYKKQQEYAAELRDTCEEIYRQCDIEDLEYLSDLAKSYAMMQRVGASTMSEFLSNVRDARQMEIHCPSCKSTNYVLSGTYQAQGEKIQRYKCKACNTSFTLNKQSLVSGSSFSFRDWIKFIDCLYNGYTLDQIARSCGITKGTALNNRTRLFYALKLLNDKVKLQGNVVIDETYIPVSYKGNHSESDNFVMPREAYKRGGENHKKGITDDLVCIVCAVDDNGNSVAKVAGTGNTSAAKLKYVLGEHFSSDVFCIYSDKSCAIKKFAEICQCEIKQEKLLRKGTKKAKSVEFNRDTYIINRYLQIVNSYHSRLKRFLSRFSGISTKYLSGYLYLFAWKECNKEREPAEAYKELLAIMTEPNNYLSVSDIINEGHLPDAIDISQNYRKKNYVPSERDREIYRRYMNEETMTSIAASYRCTKQAISLTIEKLRNYGYAPKTEKYIQRDQVRQETPQGNIPIGALRNLIRDYELYEARQNWTGNPAEFYQEMSKQYGISAQRVQNNISVIKRILKLKEEILVFESASFQSISEVYQTIYSEYQTMKKDSPGTSNSACSKALAEKHGFKPGNIDRIIKIMETEIPEKYFSGKKKLTKTETFNRDKALFIEYLKWPGERQDFCRYAAKKYDITPSYATTILRYCLYANPKRYNMA